MKIVNFLWIYLSERTRKKIRLFLIIAFHDNPVATPNHCFESFDHLVLRQNWTFHPRLDPLHASALFIAPHSPRARSLFLRLLCHRFTPNLDVPITLSAM